MSDHPHIVVLAGPNGAGKSTVAPNLLRGTLGVTEFVNADTIASGLSAFSPESVALQAGRMTLARLHQLAADRATFAFETTLASRTFAPWLRTLMQADYTFDLMFLWLPSPDMAIARVQERVRMGGHYVPDEVIRRRYNRGLRNFFDLYRPLATRWQVFDSSSRRRAVLIAKGCGTNIEKINRKAIWEQVLRSAGYDR